MKSKRLSKPKRLSKAKRVAKAKRLSLDIITTLPQPIIETILCLLSIKEAARTSILSREWRYKWTKIPKLDFSHPYGCQIIPETSKLIHAIHQVMSLRQGPIHEVTLFINDFDRFGKTGFPSCELDQIIRHLSKNHPVKKLRLDFDATGNDCYNLPISVFSLHHLTDLYLGCCGFDHQPVFNEIRGLTSLCLDLIRISIKTLLHLLSTSPSLKRFSLLMFKDHVVGRDEKSTMTELFECLPVIEHLTIWSEISPWFVPDLVPRDLPTSLIHLKYFRFEQMSFHDGYALTFLAVLIKSSPNLEKIELEMFGWSICQMFGWSI
ncbi:F-box/FBD/LRR-repeat protein At1g13570-like isoform X3 [Helianthus annuus]|uniref:F-box/FBD/LRR-repeat protein At1g13570-like isoform X3 n=1 Tax=Helianthus annuus TaxID=4232 RepID=UPI000B8F6A7B|nr:F-box/FBD/LRR-repeat protein At1g13570-like isoform X3 [Helianthus annuus]